MRKTFHKDWSHLRVVRNIHLKSVDIWSGQSHFAIRLIALLAHEIVSDHSRRLRAMMIRCFHRLLPVHFDWKDYLQWMCLRQVSVNGQLELEHQCTRATRISFSFCLALKDHIFEILHGPLPLSGPTEPRKGHCRPY